MGELLPALAFSLVIGAQFLAVIAVHHFKPAGSANIARSVDLAAAASSAST
jgi:hypothetical protein